MNRLQNRANGKMMLLVAAFLFVAIYLAFTFLLYQDSRLLSNAELLTGTTLFLQRQSNVSMFHSPEFFRKVAEEQQYFPHDPATLTQFYRTALLNGPADHATFASYAAYLGSRGCCKEQALQAWEESVRLCATYAKMRLVAASGYLSFGEKERALRNLRAAIDLDSSIAPRVYKLAEETGFELQQMIAMTPSAPSAMMQLAHYLVSKGQTGAPFKAVLDHLGKMTLTGAQRVELIRYAMNAGYYDVATHQARIASAREDTRADGYELLAEIAWRQNDMTHFETYAAQAERGYLDHGNMEKAAQFALEASSRLNSRQDKSDAARRLEKLLMRYPRYAPAFYQMSQFNQNNPEAQLYYLEKAVALDPPAYQKELAAAYLRVGKFEEAETIYKRLASVSENQVDAYIGWSRCRVAQGNLLGAMDILKTGIDRTNGAPPLILQLAEVYDSFGDYQNAALMYEAYSRAEPQRVDGYLRAAEVYMKTAQYWKAREQYAKILEREPGNAEARSKLSYLESIGY